MRRIVSLVAAAGLLLAGCTSEGGPQTRPDPSDRPGRSSRPFRTNPPVVVHAASLERFDACEELIDYLREEGTKRVGPYGLQGGYFGGPIPDVDTMGMPAAAAAESDAGGATAGSTQRTGAVAEEFSTTNVQERDVDEPDMVKTNGRHIFTVRSRPSDGRTELVAVAVGGGTPKAGGTILLPEGVGTDLLLAGNRAVVMGGGYAMPMRGGAIADMAYPAPTDAVIAIVDLSDVGAMRVTDTLKLEGSYASARMVDGIVRVVINTATQERLDFEQPQSPEPAAARATLEHNRRVARSAKIDQWLPRYEIQDASGKTTSEGPLTSCDSTYHPKTFSGFQTTSVVTIDPASPEPKESAAVMGGAGIVYASTENLYVATQRWPEPIPVDLANPEASMRFTPDPAKTSIHRFDIRDTLSAAYAASGEVRGTVLNQWSLSEHDGSLRVATTEDAFSAEGPSSSSSFVTVLDATAGELRRQGQVGNIGPGERIYGVRFIGDLGYVVTFKQIDPLHVVDLGDPSEPKVVGELKIPGYSAYLHPVGDGLLLGVGQDVDPETTAPLGTQLSLFDVSDPTEPRRIDDVRIDRSTTPVEHDHHAFTWWGPSTLAIVPISRYDVVAEPMPVEPGPDGGGSTGSAGREAPEQRDSLHAAIGYRIADRQIREIGRASHSGHVDERVYGGVDIQRTIVIGDRVFSVSYAGVMSSDLGSFDERGWYAFAG